MPAEQTRYIGLAGLGFMGKGIATCLLLHDFHVVAFDPDPSAIEQARSYIQNASLEIANVGIDCAALSHWSERLHFARSLTEFQRCELIIETIIEDSTAKQALFDQLEECVGSPVPIASNTSSFPITMLQAPRKHPERFAGMHWAGPAYATRFMEIVRGEQTNSHTIETIMGIARQLDKDPAVVQKDVAGFVANRLAYAMYREALSLLGQGVADVETIDLLCRNSLGLWTPLCGPFRWMDISGGPALYAKAMETIVPTLASDTAVPASMLRRQQNEERGTLNGRGFYTYQPDGFAMWEAILSAYAWKAKEVHDAFGEAGKSAENKRASPR